MSMIDRKKEEEKTSRKKSAVLGETLLRNKCRHCLYCKQGYFHPLLYLFNPCKQFHPISNLPGHRRVIREMKRENHYNVVSRGLLICPLTKAIIKLRKAIIKLGPLFPCIQYLLNEHLGCLHYGI